MCSGKVHYNSPLISGGPYMPIYRAPVDDYPLPVLNELLELDKQRDLPGFADLSPDLVDDILTNAGKFCEEVLQPLNQSGDEEGCAFRERRRCARPRDSRKPTRPIAKPAGAGLARRQSVGGAGMPTIITMAVAEMGDERQPVACDVSRADRRAPMARCWRPARRWMKQHIVPKMIVGRMGRHHVPDRAAAAAPICA